MHIFSLPGGGCNGTGVPERNLYSGWDRDLGGADGIRTHDLLDAIEARSQLRHGPTESELLVILQQALRFV